MSDYLNYLGAHITDVLQLERGSATMGDDVMDFQAECACGWKSERYESGHGVTISHAKHCAVTAAWLHRVAMQLRADG